MPRWLYALTAFGVVAVVADRVGAPPVLIFVAACVGMIPLAGLIGHATGQVAVHLGAHWGGLLNATFGNAAELIITVFALHEGLFTLVKASITGSIVGNTLLVLGLAMVAGGLRHGVLRFDARLAGLSSSLMLLAVAGLLLPAVFGTLVPDHDRLEALSVVVAAILLVAYVAYLLFLFTGPAPQLEAEHNADGETWGLRRGLFALAAATAGTAIVSESLVSAVGPVTAQLGWTELFLGVIVIPIVGNAAENWAAVRAAYHNQVDLTLGITSGSSTQIPLFVTPVLILLSLAIGNPMTLVFNPLELVVLVLSSAISAYIALDGESHWLEGALLLALYLMTAAVFFLDPIV